MASNETIVISTPEPTSITDAYAIIKMVSSEYKDITFKLVINRVTSPKEGQTTAEKISMVAKRFLNINIDTLGFVEEDHHVIKSVKQQTPFIIAYPNSNASKNIELLAERFITENTGQHEQNSSGMKGFVQRLFTYLKQ